MTDTPATPVKTAAELHRERAQAAQAKAQASAARKEESALEKQRANDQRIAQAQAKASRERAARSAAKQAEIAEEAAKVRAKGADNHGVFSPAERFRQAKAAQAESGTTNDDGSPIDPAIQALGKQLTADLAALKGIESIEKKAEAKAPMFENYRAHVMARLDADEPVEDPIFALMSLWALDIGEHQLATDMTAYLVRHGLKLPPDFRRSPASAHVEDLAQAALKDDSPVTMEDLAYLLRRVTDDNWDMLDGVKAQLLKAIGRRLADKAVDYDPDANDNPPGGQKGLIAMALTNLRQALSLDKEVGVKGDIKKLESLDKKIADG